ncbi:helix-turn-helix transcriptional regulator [Pseudomonas sp. PDM14]|uniref:helix-turn-helix domain-containing protein n=1 Tax=Pseudomonas sp. PDM14 TaxID=2769288 RepID=UPI00177CA4FF|nr:helix-turn-helix transcriptional regulator [Pseudomonas sp. PDM14]MBD9483883.1 helix-turn-helix transcriptional regulator [Pseudomonas sp. PDM14]
MTIGERLKEERSRLGFSQTDLGAAGGVGKTTQINYEKGNGSPDAFYLAAVARLGVDVLYVVTGERRPVAAESFTASEAALVDHYRKLPAEEQAGVMRTTSALAATIGMSFPD